MLAAETAPRPHHRGECGALAQCMVLYYIDRYRWIASVDSRISIQSLVSGLEATLPIKYINYYDQIIQ